MSGLKIGGKALTLPYRDAKGSIPPSFVGQEVTVQSEPHVCPCGCGVTYRVVEFTRDDLNLVLMAVSGTNTISYPQIALMPLPGDDDARKEFGTNAPQTFTKAPAALIEFGEK